MKTEIKKLQELGANVQEVKDGLKLIGDWKDSYNEFNFVITIFSNQLNHSNAGL